MPQASTELVKTNLKTIGEVHAFDVEDSRRFVMKILLTATIIAVLAFHVGYLMGQNNMLRTSRIPTPVLDTTEPYAGPTENPGGFHLVPIMIAITLRRAIYLSLSWIIYILSYPSNLVYDWLFWLLVAVEIPPNIIRAPFCIVGGCFTSSLLFNLVLARSRSVEPHPHRAGLAWEIEVFLRVTSLVALLLRPLLSWGLPFPIYVIFYAAFLFLIFSNARRCEQAYFICLREL